VVAAAIVAGIEAVRVSYDDDVALVRRVLRADARAEAELVRRVMPVLRAVAGSILGSSSCDADDGVQIALMRVLERASTYRGEAALESWSRTIGVRACLRLAETTRRHRPAAAEVEEQGAPEDCDDALVEDIPGPIAAYLDRLPDAQRQALVLRHALGYSVAEVAELLGVPVDTAKSRLMFGLRSLRKAIRRDVLIGGRGGATGGGRA
jgi:RNA polymerase sigma-70 factor (ECF subfamily)